MNITEFLLARIQEDELDAQADAGEMANSSVSIQFDCATQARFTPTRVLAECAAKRAIIEQAIAASDDHATVTEDYCIEQDQSEAYANDPGLIIMRALAGVYKDHPDCQQEWAL